MKKWYYFDTRFMTLKKTLTDYLESKHMQFECYGGNSYYRVDAFLTEKQKAKVESFISDTWKQFQEVTS